MRCLKPSTRTPARGWSRVWRRERDRFRRGSFGMRIIRRRRRRVRGMMFWRLRRPLRALRRRSEGRDRARWKESAVYPYPWVVVGSCSGFSSQIVYLKPSITQDYCTFVYSPYFTQNKYQANKACTVLNRPTVQVGRPLHVTFPTVRLGAGSNELVTCYSEQFVCSEAGKSAHTHFYDPRCRS